MITVKMLQYKVGRGWNNTTPSSTGADIWADPSNGNVILVDERLNGYSKNELLVHESGFGNKLNDAYELHSGGGIELNDGFKFNQGTAWTILILKLDEDSTENGGGTSTCNTVQTITDNRVVDILKVCVARAGAKLIKKLQAIDSLITCINFEYGHYTDIQQRLVQYSMNHINIYPLFCVFEDFKIERGADGLDGIAKLTAILLYPSKAEYTRSQRDEKTFKPVLFPCYKEILRQLKICGEFNIYDETLIKHSQINRPHWGDPVLFDVDGYLFGAALDGIELADLQLETYLQTC